MITSLVFSDAHIEPRQDLSRFDSLGRMICDRKPDYIYDLGDTFSLSSISGWDLSKRLSMEGRRYVLDMEAGREAVDRLFRPLRQLQEHQRKTKQRIYKPHRIWMKGNHEYRGDRYAEQNPELGGMLDIGKDTGYVDEMDEVHEYKARIIRNGINFMHCPLAGNDQPISGLHIPYKALQRFNNHIVMGHYHRSESSSIRRTDATGIQRAIVCPAFFDGQPHYLSPNAPCVIDRGVLLIHQSEGDFVPEVEEISLDRLYCEY